MPPTSHRSVPAQAPNFDEHAFSEALDHLLDGVLAGSLDGRVLHANPAACSLLGSTNDELCARGRQGILDESDPRWKVAEEERARTGRAQCEVAMLRADGTRFDAEVATAVFTSATGELHSTVIFRDVTARHRLGMQLAATNDIHRQLLERRSTSEVLASIAEHARALFDASDAALVVPGPEPGSMFWRVGLGPRLSRFTDYLAPPGSHSARAMESGQPVIVDNLAALARFEEGRILVGPAMIVPIVSDEQAFGNLVVLAAAGSPPYNESDLDVALTFAQSAGVALALGEARRAIESNLSRTTMQLEEALARRVVVEQAKGFISASLGVGTADAFERLRSYARRNHQKIHDVAAEVLQRRLLP
jgi:PAS domain S-box-containing protein